MAKTRFIIYGLFTLLIGAFAIYYILDKKVENELFVKVDDALFVDKIRIEIGFYSINSGSDENLVKMGLGEVIFSNSKAKGFETICGENDFLVVYDNQFYTIIRHFIPNDFYDGVPEPHIYNFDFKRIGEKIHLALDIKGEDGERIEKKLVSVIDAKNNIWGQEKKQR